MEQRIINRYIDLDKISRKEVNFKSKLIEWSQKNKMEVSFELIEQFLDHDSNPVFQTEVRIEGLPAGTGTGYSKKESQQNAAQMAIKKVREADFVNMINEAKEQRNLSIVSESVSDSEEFEPQAGEIVIESDEMKQEETIDNEVAETADSELTQSKCPSDDPESPDRVLQ